MSTCRVTVNLSRCSGIGMCEGTSPEFFQVDNDGHARVLTAHIPADRFDDLCDAAANCPTQSVTVELVD